MVGVIPSKVELGMSLLSSLAALIMAAEESMPTWDPFPWARILAKSALRIPSI